MLAPVDVIWIQIETDSLILRALKHDGQDDYSTYASVPGVGEMAGWPHHKDIAVSQSILDLFIQEKKTFALVLKETGNVIGSLGLEGMDPDPHEKDLLGREVGYVLSKEYWGRGLMPEAVNAVARYCFDTLWYDYLTCCHFRKNVQSKRVIEKCGFQYFGESMFKTTLGTMEPSCNYIRYNPNKGR